MTNYYINSKYNKVHIYAHVHAYAHTHTHIE